MEGKCCAVCKIVGIVAIIGCLNWGSIGLLGTNFVETIFGVGSTITRVVYIVVGLAGVALLLAKFKACPCNKKG